jgi:Eukaryotic cytochrome b561
MGKAERASPFADTERSRSIANKIGILLSLFALGFGVYASYIKLGYNWIWYSWHPISMIVSFVALGGNAILIKKIGGYENTKRHGYLMVLGSVLAAFAWYVIYTNKNMQGKKHLTSIHGKLGAAVLLGNVSLATVGAVALNPNWGFMKTNKLFRKVHKISGRAVTAAAWLSCMFGFATTEKDFAYRAAFGFSLLSMAYFVLV